MTKELKIILASSGLLIFALIAYFIVRSDSKPSQDENILASEIDDTKYTYNDMQASNDAKTDDYRVQDTYNTFHARPEPTNNTQVESNNEYSNEVARIRQVSQNIEHHKSIDETHEQNASISQMLPHKKQNINEHNIPDMHEKQPKKTIDEPIKSKKGNLFNDSSSDPVASIENELQDYIRAVIHGEQSIQDGSMVKLRTTHDFNLDGETISRNTFILGQAAISENRLNINISGIKANGTIFRTNMIAVDQDGTSGLRLIGGHGEGVTDKAIDVADYSTSSVLTNIPVIGSIAQGTREILRSKRSTNKKPIILGSNYKVFLKKL